MAGICKINNGRLKKCKGTRGGVKSVFIAPYKKVLRSEIVTDGITITGFPVTFVYEFELLGDVAFLQNENKNDGGIYQDISLSLNFKDVNVFDNLRFQKMINRDYFIVILDRNGNYFLSGLQNGLTCESLKSGADDIYTLEFKGQEIDRAQFCNTLIGTELLPVTTIDYILQNNDDYVLQSTEYILK